MKALLVFVCVALPGVAFAQAVSPGPLAADHSSLEGVDNCIKCHSGGGHAISLILRRFWLILKRKCGKRKSGE